jgi:hypothetical protein
MWQWRRLGFVIVLWNRRQYGLDHANRNVASRNSHWKRRRMEGHVRPCFRKMVGRTRWFKPTCTIRCGTNLGTPMDAYLWWDLWYGLIGRIWLHRVGKWIRMDWQLWSLQPHAIWTLRREWSFDALWFPRYWRRQMVPVPQRRNKRNVRLWWIVSILRWFCLRKNSLVRRLGRKWMDCLGSHWCHQLGSKPRMVRIRP